MAEVDELTALRSRVRRTGRALTLLALIASPVVIAFVLFGVPVLGNHVMLSIARDLGCRVAADGPHQCMVFGIDAGETVYGYAVGSLTGGIGNPLLVLRMFDKIIPFEIIFYGTQLWFIATVTAVVLRRDALKRLRLSGGVLVCPLPAVSGLSAGRPRGGGANVRFRPIADMGLLIVTLGERLKIWDRFDLDEGTQYVLLLMENEDGRRSFRLVEQERALTEVAQNNDVVLLSKPVPHALAASRNLMQISELVRLSDDQSFYVDGHGNWFTAEEYEDFVQGHSITRWVRGRPPKLAPK